MSKRQRRLFLQIKAKAPGASRRAVIGTLLESIAIGTYTYPTNWRVGIRWSNKSNEDMLSRPMKEFTREMKQSRQSSPGWDIAVGAYLESQL